MSKFVKGKSGNPKGRKKGLESSIRVELRHRITDDDFQKAVDVVRYHLKRHSLEAARLVIEHKIGKPKQQVELETGETFESWIKRTKHQS